MKIIVGGCGSSGTTLMRKILNAHPEIYCGEEASLFDRPGTLDYSTNKLKALMSVDHYNAHDAAMTYPIIRQTSAGAQSYFGLSEVRWLSLWPHTPRENALVLLDKMTTSELFDFLLTEEALANGKKYWAEKTPGNIFTMNELDLFYSDLKLILCVRNPMDTIASLIFNRKFNLFSAITRWVASAQKALKLAKQTNIYPVNYDLLCDVNANRDLLGELWNFIGVDPGSPSYHGADLIEPAKQTWDGYKDRMSPGMMDIVHLCTGALWEDLEYAIHGDPDSFNPDLG